MRINQGLLPYGQKAFQSAVDVLHILKLSQADASTISHFNKAFEISDFQLGNHITPFSLANLSESSVHSEQKPQGFYVICQGQVRLLGFDAIEGREVSVMVLEAGECFGTEGLFANTPSLTRAIAASNGQATWIPQTDLLWDASSQAASIYGGTSISAPPRSETVAKIQRTFTPAPPATATNLANWSTSVQTLRQRNIVNILLDLIRQLQKGGISM